METGFPQGNWCRELLNWKPVFLLPNFSRDIPYLPYSSLRHWATGSSPHWRGGGHIERESQDLWDGCPPHQVIKHNSITNNGTNWHHTPSDTRQWDRQCHLCSSLCFFFQTPGNTGTLEGDKSALKNVGIMKKKKKMSNCLRLQETKEKR